MLFNAIKPVTLALGLTSLLTVGATPTPNLDERQIPDKVHGYKTVKSPGGVTIRYKEPGKDGVCETTPGVNSYSGYIDLSPTMHTFFWFFEARKDPHKKPLTLWLNGGPGSDSLIGLFQELGPCNVTKYLKTEVNPHSWSEVSNLLFISQPIGTGFSYGEEIAGSLNPYTGEVENSTFGGVDGEWPIEDADKLGTTELAAVATWHALQGLLGAMPHLDNKVDNKSFNLWTESYGGHYGPAFFNYFYEENKKIDQGYNSGVKLNFDTLGIINGIVDEVVQAPYYPEFAVHNTYGIKAVNDTVYDYMKFALNMPGGCLDLCQECAQVNRSTDVGRQICFQATDQCRTNVEQPYYSFSGRGVYDIRHPYKDPTPPLYFQEYLNLPHVRQSIGVELNYTDSNADIFYAFQRSGDFSYPNFMTDLEEILDNGVRVGMFYGDADYICNWFGGQAASLAVNYTHSEQFAKAGYAPFMVDGTEYGEVRECGNFSFTRVYEAGHEVPYYQPKASLEFFKRTLDGLDIATGKTVIDYSYKTHGEAMATHTESPVALPPATGAPVVGMAPAKKLLEQKLQDVLL